MNVCFAICITFLIFQNQQLKDQADTLKGFAQLDTDKSFDRLDEIDEWLAEAREVINSNNKSVRLLITESERHDENVLILEENDKRLQETILRIETYLVDNVSGKLR
jgi:anion-transporting  ArsA/GET3 family ATPase